MRFILERSDAGEDVTPTSIAEYLGVSAASVTGMLDRLHGGGLLSFQPNPKDGRSKLVVPFDRDIDRDDTDPLTAQIRGLAGRLSPETAREVTGFLEKITAAVERECR